MVGSWYLTHATKNASWIFMRPFFLFFCFVEEGTRMMYEQICRTKRYAICRSKRWWCNDSCKMWGWNMITDKWRNDMFIMMPWRDAYARHDMNAFTDTRARKIISPYLHIWGRNAPCVQLRRRYGSSDFPRKRRDPHTMHVWRHDADAQKRNKGIYTAWQYPQIIIQQRRTWPLG